MHVPQKLADLLSESTHHQRIVNAAILKLEPIIKDSKTPFFPNYSNHGIEHIEAVCVSAQALITDDAWKVFTPADAAVLVLSTLFHDLAMHTTEDQFVELVTNRARPTIKGTNDFPWPVLWERFLTEAKRFDGRKIQGIFGRQLAVQAPPLNPGEMTEENRLLIGEFLRKHHARLAHEHALFGLSGGEGRIAFDEIDYELRDLAGLVARSHNEPLRAMFPYLSEHYGLQEYDGVHAIYLGALLRIADYLQIEAGRAPKEVLKVRHLRSPVSYKEWKAHHAVRDVRLTDDPEAVFIDIVPESISTYVKVHDLIQDIQRELDTTWATLGEVYGRFGELRGLGLTLRRVRSSYDDPEKLARKLSFVPVDAKFRTADSDVLKLLIKPLYGDKPEVGVRELIQNSLDAVRELASLREQGLTTVATNSLDYNSDLLVSVVKDGERHYVSVHDRGIGMNAEIIKDYFLVAGASFRRSSHWLDRFTDDEGKSKVARSGRFGVGALAAFLIGDRIKVTTRRFDLPEDQALTFEASLDDETIQIEPCLAPIGTTIQIEISETVFKSLLGQSLTYDVPPKIDWYTLADPVVAMVAVIDEERTRLDQQYTLPTPTSRDLKDWTLIKPDGYSGVLWKYGKAPRLTCNGIKIPEGHGSLVHLGSELTSPSVSVFDPNGILPLNLQRSEVDGSSSPLVKTISDSVAQHFLDYVVASAPRSSILDREAIEWYRLCDYEGVRDVTGHNPFMFFSTSEAMFLWESDVLRASRIRQALVVQFATGKVLYPAITTDEQIGLFGEITGDSAQSFLYAFRRLVDQGDFRRTYSDKGTVPQHGVRISLSRDRWERYGLETKLPKYLKQHYSLEREQSGFLVFRAGACPKKSEALDQVLDAWSKMPPGARGVLASEHYLDLKAEVEVRTNAVTRAWIERIGSSGLAHRSPR